MLRFNRWIKNKACFGLKWFIDEVLYQNVNENKIRLTILLQEFWYVWYKYGTRLTFISNRFQKRGLPA